MNKFSQKIKNLVHFFFAWFAYWYYGRPGRKIIVIGVTGTKGKSSTCRFIASALEAKGDKVGLLSTAEFQIADKRWLNDKKMTMLGRGQVQKMLKEMVKIGCKYAVVETSSEGILQHRHYGLHYDIAVFTNLGTEHSERHGGFKNLKRDKGRLFAALSKYPHKILDGKKVPKVIIANADDANASYYLDFPADKKFAYGFSDHPELAPAVEYFKVHFEENDDPMRTDFAFDDGRCFHLMVPGKFNVYNALAGILTAESQNIDLGAVSAHIFGVYNIPGRMEFIDAGQSFKVLVDYAHEPMSLTALFTTLRSIVGKNNKVIAVIGSDGGGRDKAKRFTMGEIAGKLCDTVIVSDVNSFDEDPKEIAEMLAKGARQAGKTDNENLFIITERRLGMKKALELAQPGDAVVFTAKGTEPCIVGANGKKIPWDDRNVARELLRELHF